MAYFTACKHSDQNYCINATRIRQNLFSTQVHRPEGKQKPVFEFVINFSSHLQTRVLRNCSNKEKSIEKSAPSPYDCYPPQTHHAEIRSSVLRNCLGKSCLLLQDHRNQAETNVVCLLEVKTHGNRGAYPTRAIRNEKEPKVDFGMTKIIHQFAKLHIGINYEMLCYQRATTRLCYDLVLVRRNYIVGRRQWGLWPQQLQHCVRTSHNVTASKCVRVGAVNKPPAIAVDN